jgi:hypothetical protein
MRSGMISFIRSDVFNTAAPLLALPQIPRFGAITPEAIEVPADSKILSVLLETDICFRETQGSRNSHF